MHGRVAHGLHEARDARTEALGELVPIRARDVLEVVVQHRGDELLLVASVLADGHHHLQQVRHVGDVRALAHAMTERGGREGERFVEHRRVAGIGSVRARHGRGKVPRI